MSLTTKSKFLSLVLRHNPGKINIKLDENGWAKVSEIIERMPISKQELEKIVATDSKQRYAFSEDGTMIRANQGHSIAVDLGLEETIPPDILWHGTSDKAINPIMKNGLKPMGRQYVHLTDNQDTAMNVGKRHGKPKVLKIDAKKMYEQGKKFYLSKNKVWLVDAVAPEFLS